MLESTVGCLTIMENLHKPYFETPGVVKMWMSGTWDYSISNAEYARKVFTQSDVYQKVNSMDLMPGRLDLLVVGKSLIFENGYTYRGHCVVVNPAFCRTWPMQLSKKLLIDMVEVMEDEADKPLHVLPMLRRAIIDVLGHIIMGYSFDALRNPGNNKTAMYDSLVDAIVDPVYSILPWLDKFPMGEHTKQWKALDKYRAFIEGMIDEKFAELENNPALTEEEHNNANLLTLLLESYIMTKSGKMLDERGKPIIPLTKEELRDNISLFYIAGYDTTANSLSYVMMELARHPEIQQKAREIVISMIGDTRNAYPNDDQIKKLGYIDLIVKETLRKAPIVTDVRCRLSEPVQFGPYSLPKGVVIIVDIWLMHYNPANFHEPEKFIPEWFVDDKSADVKNVAPFTFTAFSNGSRQCMGMKFSLIEQRIAIALLLLRFEWTLPTNSPFWHSTPTTPAGLVMPVGLIVDLKRRH
ncbi:hypothetical protein LPJ66_006954 [Kickxella alabastrina]|uniref:Uncharacterized protein n=1 Tax=Kickxella alabastrina TaxID=61397 RepID=A0ACC1IAU3_9FUNG|nr:hypothetical protein LPJ66_006954 [Kickxella alabastrina]